MGNKSSQTSFGHNPTLKSKLIQSEPGLQIYQNAQGEQYQKYIVPCDPHYQQTYEFRVNNKHSQLVDIIYAGQSKGAFSCNSLPNIVVVTERIPYRLENLPPQQLLNAVTILKCSLLGFKDLFKVNGLICVRDTMIGISAKNKVKVWLNTNFAINKPQPYPPSLQKLDSSLHERQMVQNIFDLINSKADPNPTWRQLTHARETRQIQKFEEALNLIEQFTIAHKMSISDEVRNPFNKNLYHQREDYNSQIDKLEELRNKSHDLSMERNAKAENYGKVENVVRNERVLEGHPPSQFKKQFKQPFYEIERNQRINNQAPVSRPVSYSPAPIRSSSSSRPLQIKFNYQGQSQGQTERVNPLQMIPAATLAQQISRSSSQPKVVQSISFPSQHSYQQVNSSISPALPQVVNSNMEGQKELQQKEKHEQTIIENLQGEREKEETVVVRQINQQNNQKSIQQHFSPERGSPSSPQSGSQSEQPSPTFHLPREQLQKNNDQREENKDFSITLNKPESNVHQQQFVSVEPGTSLKQIIISQPYDQSHNQAFFGAKQTHSINTEGSSNSYQSFSKYADIFPQAKRAVSIKEGQLQSNSKKKQQIPKLQKIEELNSFIGMSDSQELNSPAKVPKSAKKNQTALDLQIQQVSKSVTVEQRSSQPEQVMKPVQRKKIEKMSYKDMRKMLLQTMQN